MEKRFKNIMTFEEAQTVWDNNTEKLLSDYIVIYEEPKMDDENDLIGIEDPNEVKVDLVMKILAVGEKVTNAKINDTVLLNPGMFQSGIILHKIEDCYYGLLSDRAVIKICK